MQRPANPSPAPDTWPGDDDDYELTIWVDYDFRHYPPSVCRGGDAKFVLECGREHGRWRLRLLQVLVEDRVSGETIQGPVLLDLTGQTGSPDPLAALQTFLRGHMVVDGERVIRELHDHEVAALDAKPMDQVVAHVRALQSEDLHERDIARLALTRSPDEIARLRVAEARWQALARDRGFAPHMSRRSAIELGRISWQEYAACWDDPADAEAGMA